MNRAQSLSLLFALGCIFSPRSEALILCVSTGDQLANALSAASSNGQFDQIRLRAGTFLRTSATGVDYAYSGGENLLMTGGWSGANGTCTTQTPQPGLSVLDGELQGRVLEIKSSPGTAPTLVFSNFTVTRGKATDNTAAGAINIQIYAGDNPSISLTRLQVLDSTAMASGAAGIRAEAVSGKIYVYGNLIAGNQNSNPQFGVGGLAAFAGDFGSFYASNNTITNNTSSAPTDISPGGMYVFSRNVALVANNVVAGNFRLGNASEMAFDSGPGQYDWTIVNNHWGSAAGVYFANGFAPEVFGTQTGPAGFVSSTDFRPTSNSPLRDSGSNADAGGQTMDLDGNPRVQAGAVDRGAYEFVDNTLFKSSFE